MTISEFREAWPGAIAIKEPSGWSIYGGIENLLEMDAVLARDQPTEREAWEEAREFYEDMTMTEPA